MRLSQETYTLGQPLFVSQGASSLRVHDLGPERATSSHEGVQVWFDLHGILVTPRKVDEPYYRLDGEEYRVTHIACTDAGLTAVALAPTRAPRTMAIMARAYVLMFRNLETLLDVLYLGVGIVPGSQIDDTSTQSQQGHSQVHEIPVNRSYERIGRSFLPTSLRTLLSTRTGFLALTHDGDVYTWGDTRFPHALGRKVSIQYPSNEPGRVEELMGLNVVKIVAGGSIMGALTEGGDAFVWGVAESDAGHTTSMGNANRGRLRDVLASKDEGEHIAPICLPVIDDDGAIKDGASIDDYESPEIFDIAVGDGHLLVIDADHHVWVCGSNEHGQLGLGEPIVARDEKESAKWHLVRTFEQLREQDGKPAQNVYAGDLNSFVIVQDVRQLERST